MKKLMTIILTLSLLGCTLQQSKVDTAELYPSAPVYGQAPPPYGPPSPPVNNPNVLQLPPSPIGNGHMINETSEVTRVKGWALVTDQQPPPSINTYPNVTTNKYDLYHYLDDLNWYLIYIYSYTLVVNKYGIENGWPALKEAPICKYMNYPELSEPPEFKPSDSEVTEIGGFEWALTEYIEKLNTLRNRDVAAIEAAKELQRTICVY